MKPLFCLILLPALCLGALTQAAASAAAPPINAEQRSRALALGPWPPPFVADPSNRVSGHPLAIELGRRLFNDPRMSPVGYIGCVTCHQTDRAFTDLKARAHGLADLPRNTMAIANLSQQRWFGWGGSSDSLWLASLRPMLDPREFDSNPDIVARIFVRDPELAACYRAVFNEAPLGDTERIMVNTAKALAAFLETLVTQRTPFDEFRDALARADVAGLKAYPLAAQRGLQLFVGPLGCVRCHAGPNLSDGGFHRARSQATDQSRADGLRELKASRYSLRSAFNDDGSGAGAKRLSPATPADRGAFRTPTLRNVAVTAPYLHDGRVDELRNAVVHPWNDATQRMPRPTPAQVQDLLAFLHTLTDAHGARRPLGTPAIACP